MGANLVFFYAHELCQALVREAHGLDLLKVDGIVRQAVFTDFVFGFDELFDLPQEPRLIFTRGENLIDSGAVTEGLCDHQQPIRCRGAKYCADGVLVVTFTEAGDDHFIKAAEACFKAAQGFLHGLLKRASNGHDFANGFHGCRKNRLGTGKFFEGKAWNFRDHIVDGGFKGCGCGTACDVVGEFIKCVTHGKFCSDLGDWKACRF